jgi:pyocin large subunit-like protein
MEDLGERWTRDEDGSTHKIPANTTFEDWKQKYIDQKAAEVAQHRAETIAAATPLFNEMQNIGLMRMPDLETFAEMSYNNSPAYKNLLSRYQNITGQREWTAVEFNPDTLADHFKRHGSDIGTDAKSYAAAALEFVNGATEKATIIDGDGVRRMYSETENLFAAVYPDGTISTFFHPRAGKKYWESQVKKYAEK